MASIISILAASAATKSGLALPTGVGAEARFKNIDASKSSWNIAPLNRIGRSSFPSRMET